jgi:hypothetical protein
MSADFFDAIAFPFHLLVSRAAAGEPGNRDQCFTHHPTNWFGPGMGAERGAAS